MLPLFKLFSLFVRILARPIIARTKAHTSSKLQDAKLRGFFVWCGNKAHRVNVYVNRRLLKLESTTYKVQDLSENAALELGVESFYEVIIYACILGLPIIEIYRAYAEGEEKSAKQRVVMSTIEQRLAKLEASAEKSTESIAHIKDLSFLLHEKTKLLALTAPAHGDELSRITAAQ